MRTIRAWGRLATALLVALLALCGSARADELSARFTRGEMIGEGAMKVFFAIEGQPGLALGVVKMDALRARGLSDGEIHRLIAGENAMLDRIAADGVPTARTLQTGTWHGQPAMIQERFLTGFKVEAGREIWAGNFHEVRGSVLSEATFASIDQIERRLLRADAPFVVQDPQVLLAADGRVAINDPYAVLDRDHPDRELLERQRAYLSETLTRLRHYATEAVWARRAPLLRRLPGREDGRVRGFLDAGVLWFDANADAGVWRDALARWLEQGPSTEEAKRVARAVRDGRLDVRFFDRQIDLERHGAPGPNEVRLASGVSFPKLASELVRQGSRILSGRGGIEAEVMATADALAFRAAKKVPDDLDRESEVFRRGAELRGNARALVDLIAWRRGEPLDEGERARIAHEAGLRMAGARGPARGLVDALDGERDRAGRRPTDAHHTLHHLASEVTAAREEIRETLRDAFPRVHPMSNLSHDALHLEVTPAGNEVTAAMGPGEATLRIPKDVLDGLDRATRDMSPEEAAAFRERALVVLALDAVDRANAGRLDVGRALALSGLFGESPGEEQVRELRRGLERGGLRVPDEVGRIVESAPGRPTGLLSGEVRRESLQRVRDRIRARASRGRR